MPMDVFDQPVDRIKSVGPLSSADLKPGASPYAAEPSVVQNQSEAVIALTSPTSDPKPCLVAVTRTAIHLPPIF